jgi:hypothetical protein
VSAPEDSDRKFIPDDDFDLEIIDGWKRAFSAFHPGRRVPEPSRMEMLLWLWAHISRAEQRKFAREHFSEFPRLLAKLEAGEDA